MSEFLTAVAGGLAAASLYLTYGLGLSLTYRATRVLNFAYGAVGSISGYLAYSFLQQNLPYGVAALLAIVCGVLASCLIQVLILRFLPTESPEAAGIATLGVTIIVEGVLLLKYGGTALSLPAPVVGGTLFAIGQYHVQLITVVDIGVAIAVALLLAGLLYRTRVGLAIRAMSEGTRTASMFGINPNYVQAIVWGITGGIAAITALLVTPSNYLTPDFLTDYLIAAFVVVVLGGFERILGVVIGAVVFGVVQSIFATYVTSQLTNTISFVIILVVLIFLPYGILGRPLARVNEAVIPRAGNVLLRRLRRQLRIKSSAATSAARQGTNYYILRLRAAGDRRSIYAFPIVLGGIGLLLSTIFDQSTLTLGANIAAMYVAVLGTDFVFGYAGQLSIGQAGFMMLGGYVTVLLEVKAGVPLIPALLASLAAGAVAGVIMGLPAARLRGIYLTVLTLGFALAVPELVNYFSSLTSGDNGLVAPLPSWIGGGNPRAIYVFTVVIATIAAFVVLLIGRSRLGKSWRAIKDSDMAAAASGISVVFHRVTAFAIGAALCGLGGAVMATATGFLSSESFTLWTSIYLIVAVVVGGRISTLGALLGSAFVVAIPYESSSIAWLTNLLLGIVLIIVLLVRPDGLKGLLVNVVGGGAAWVDRLRGSAPKALLESGESLDSAAETQVPPGLGEKV
jgi:ABC-type branched-subunit amino acid transport system permease subunit